MLKTFTKRLSSTFDNIRSPGTIHVDIVPEVGTDGTFQTREDGNLIIAGFVTISHQDTINLKKLMIGFSGKLNLRVSRGPSMTSLSGLKTCIQIVSQSAELITDTIFDDSDQISTFPFTFCIPLEQTLPPSCHLEIGTYKIDVSYCLTAYAEFHGAKQITMQTPILIFGDLPSPQLIRNSFKSGHTCEKIMGTTGETNYCFIFPKNVVTGENFAMLYNFMHRTEESEATAFPVKLHEVTIFLVESVTIIPKNRKFTVLPSHPLERRYQIGRLFSEELRVLGWVESELLVCKLPSWSSAIDRNDEYFHHATYIKQRSHTTDIPEVPIHGHGHGHEVGDPLADSASDIHGINSSGVFLFSNANEIKSVDPTSPLEKMALEPLPEDFIENEVNSLVHTKLEISHRFELMLTANDSKVPIIQSVPVNIWAVPRFIWSHIEINSKK
ncbi:hypothetical protein HK096_008621 [Nowakowskiella sp. JEL0078]|nr:hypothetical protein HK096_008621 [Nowakowskiella sp. JEL0078]